MDGVDSSMIHDGRSRQVRVVGNSHRWVIIFTSLSCVELSDLQRQEHDVSLVYNAVKSNTPVDLEQVSLGSSELKKLSSMQSLMQITNTGILTVGLITKGSNIRKYVAIAPKKIREKLIVDSHNLVHSGINKTIQRIRLDWYWPGMVTDTRRLVNTCEICQIAKKGIKPATLSGGNLNAGRPWQKLAIDLVGQMPTTASGNKWILVMTDHFTRWHHAIALPDATAPTIANALDNQVFCYFGLPEEIHSDRGT